MKTKSEEKLLAKLEKLIRHPFKHKHLAYEALCHKSFVYDGQKMDVKDNERLEFLGDSVLGLVITDVLFRKFETYQEGELSIIKSMLIRRETLAILARDIDLGKYLFLSKGEEASGGRSRDSILANAFESLMGAIYLDGGIRSARKFILSQFKGLLKKLPHEIHTKEYKNLLQEVSHIKHKSNPVYAIISETGPDHKKHFEATVTIKGEVYGHGSGPSKKEAEKNAAKAAYEKILEEK
ncbi:MAG: ribonuclease III [Chlamydiae bacterium]|nr:ribonuclease III [Chlamydiota bacterium]MBI3265720.1 ribonuclease III [Chlamydiota bacterium]